MLEGEFSVSFADTVSPAFIQEQFKALDITLKDAFLQPISVLFSNIESDELFEAMTTHSFVGDFKNSLFSEQDIENTTFPESYSKEQKEKLKEGLKDLASRRSIRIVFKHHVTRPMVDQYLAEFDHPKHSPIHPNYKYATVVCEKGEEEAVMARLEELPFVNSTAFIVAAGF